MLYLGLFMEVRKYGKTGSCCDGGAIIDQKWAHFIDWGEQGDFYQAPFSRTVIGQTKDRHIVLIVVESNLLGDFWWRSTRVWNEMFFPKGMSLMTLSQWLIAHGSLMRLT